MISGWAPLPPLCPASMTIVFPLTARRSSAPVTGGAEDEPPDGDPDGDGAALPGSAADGVPGCAQWAAAAGVPAPQPASRTQPANRPRLRLRRARTRLMLLARR